MKRTLKCGAVGTVERHRSHRPDGGKPHASEFAHLNGDGGTFAVRAHGNDAADLFEAPRNCGAVA